MIDNYAKGRPNDPSWQPTTLKAAGDAISRLYRRPETNVAKEREQAVQEYKEAQARRNQGPIESGKGQPREAVENLDTLREQSRTRGTQSDLAVAQRLENLGI